MNTYEGIKIEEGSIRYHFDEKSGDFYFSIVDVIETLCLSKDSRNYWKVLKNRLKNGQNKLVTECNQLKMKASDGKSYLTDVAKSGTILQIIEIISPGKVAPVLEFFNQIEKENTKNNINYFGVDITEKNLSTTRDEVGEIKVDMYQKDVSIFITSTMSGVNPENIFISLNSRELTLKFNRTKQNIEEKDYTCEELSWGKFSRIIPLPYEVDIDRVETSLNYGLLSIKLYILDKTRTKIIKVN